MPAELKQLKDLQGKLHAIGAEVAELQEKATVTRDGETFIDLDRDEVKGSALVRKLSNKSHMNIVEAIRKSNVEMDDIGKQIEGLQEAQKAFRDLDQPVKKYPQATLPDHKGGAAPQHKTAWQQIQEHEFMKDFDPSRARHGMEMKFNSMAPSDFIAMGGAANTIGMKTLMETTAGWAPDSIRLPGFTPIIQRPVQLLDIVPLMRTSVPSFTYMEETTRTNNAAETSEGATFKESAAAFTARTAVVRKITNSLPVTDEQLADVAQVGGYIRDTLTAMLRERLDSQVQAGDGNDPNLLGLSSLPNIQTQARAGDPNPDAFFKAMTLVRTTGRAQPTHSLIHSDNWQSIRLLRTVDGIYIWGNPSETGSDRMWGLPVVTTEVEAAGTGYVGSFLPQWISLFELQGVDVQVGYVNAQFGQGERTIRADFRTALVTRRQEAFCKVTGLN